MKDKYIRIISPVSLPVVLVLDASVGYYTYIAIRKVLVDDSVFAAAFLGIQIFAVIFALLTTREVLRHGVRITDSYVEFTALDSNNKVRFDEIEKITIVRDTKASFVKKAVNRYSSIVFYLNDGDVLTVELGITTKRKVEKIENEINNRLNKTEQS